MRGTTISGCIPITTCLLLAIILAGCQAGQGSRTYTRGQAQQAMSVYSGTVLKVAEVQIEKEQTAVYWWSSRKKTMNLSWGTASASSTVWDVTLRVRQ